MKAPLVVVNRSQEEKKKKKPLTQRNHRPILFIFPVVSFTHFFSFIFSYARALCRRLALPFFL
jgi:hypothetical protein